MKKILSILLTIALVLSFAGCGAAKNESSAPTEPSVDLSTVECDVFAIKGPTGIGLVNLMKKVDDGKGDDIAADNSEKDNSGVIWIIIGLVAAALICGGVIAIILIKKKKQTSPATEE